MKIKKINMKKAAVSCAAICLAGALCWNGSSITAWAAPTSGTAINDNTRVRSAIGGSPIGSLKANQEVTIKESRLLVMVIPGMKSPLTGMEQRLTDGCEVI